MKHHRLSCQHSLHSHSEQNHARIFERRSSPSSILVFRRQIISLLHGILILEQAHSKREMQNSRTRESARILFDRSTLSAVVWPSHKRLLLLPAAIKPPVSFRARPDIFPWRDHGPRRGPGALTQSGVGTVAMSINLIRSVGLVTSGPVQDRRRAGRLTSESGFR